MISHKGHGERPLTVSPNSLSSCLFETKEIFWLYLDPGHLCVTNPKFSRLALSYKINQPNFISLKFYVKVIACY